MVYLYKITTFEAQKKLWQASLFLYSMLCLFLICLAFSKKKINYNKHNDLFIYILNKKQNSKFIKKNIKYEIVDLLNTIDLSKLNTLEIMNLLLFNLNYINIIKSFRGLKGEIIIAVKMKTPLVLVYDSTTNTMSYIDKNCNVFAKPNFFICKVPLLQTKYKLEELDYKSKKELLNFLYKIKKDKFLRADISSICINERKKIVVHTISEKKVVNFGSLCYLNEKLNKLKIYYTHILPVKGFNYYKKVELSFKNQIVCE